MTGIIILAAGASTRLGRPKQLLPYQGKSLLQHAIDAAFGTACSPVIVVLGANAAAIQVELRKYAVQIVINPNWEEGMSSSIRSGLSSLINLKPDVEDVIFVVADQPFVSTGLLTSLAEQKAATGKGIIACSYKDQPGVPALFHKDFFPELLLLQGSEGAKKLFFKYPEEVALLPFAEGSIDIDTVEDYNALVR